MDASTSYPTHYVPSSLSIGRNEKKITASVPACFTSPPYRPPSPAFTPPRTCLALAAPGLRPVPSRHLKSQPASNPTQPQPPAPTHPRTQSIHPSIHSPTHPLTHERNEPSSLTLSSFSPLDAVHRRRRWPAAVPTLQAAKSRVRIYSPPSPQPCSLILIPHPISGASSKNIGTLLPLNTIHSEPVD